MVDFKLGYLKCNKIILSFLHIKSNQIAFYAVLLSSNADQINKIDFKRRNKK